MQPRRLMAVLVSAVAIALVAGACSDSDGDGDAAPTTEAEGESTTSEAGGSTTSAADGESTTTVDLVQGGSMLESVQAADVVRCGTRDDLPGFAVLDAAGEHVGFDVDFCKVIAAAVLGDADQGRVRRPRDRRPVHRPAVRRDRRADPQHHLDREPRRRQGRHVPAPRRSTTARG